MGIVLAVKKKGIIAIVSDTMTVSGGSRKQTADHVLNSNKIVQLGSAYWGVAGHPIWPLVLTSYGKKHKIPVLKSQEDVFQALLKLHCVLKDEYHLTPHSSDEDAIFESSGFESLIVNSYGIFKGYEFRSVQQFVKFAAIGSGSSYALGALCALYDRLDTAEEIAIAALNSVVEFDDSSGLPSILYTVKAK